jgi:hypothetical protein
MKSAGTEGVEAAGRGEMLGELADADSDQQTGDEGEENRERDAAARIGNPDDDGKATAAAGAMWVIDWNRVGARPTALRSRRCESIDVLMLPSL